MKLIRKLFAFFWDRSLLVFAIIGGVNTILSNVTIFVLEQYAGWPFFWASLFSYELYSVFSFYFNRKYSFKSKAPLGKSIARFFTLVTVCFFLSYGLNYLVMPWMRAQWFPNLSDMWFTVIRLLGVQVVFTLLNYVGQRLWAFKAPAPPADDTAQATGPAPE